MIAFVVAYLSIPIRFGEKYQQAPAKWDHYRKFITILYWMYMLVPPKLTSIWCWIRVYKTRDWMNRSGWIVRPNPEMIIWDQGPLFAMGVLVTILMNMLTEASERERKARMNGRIGFERVEDEEVSQSVPMRMRPLPSSSCPHPSYEPYRSY